jgi:hypothetical protein
VDKKCVDGTWHLSKKYHFLPAAVMLICDAKKNYLLHFIKGADGYNVRYG